MAHPDFFPTTLEGKLTHVMEECAEVTQEICKVQRFGWINERTKTDHRAALEAELDDLRGAITRLESAMVWV